MSTISASTTTTTAYKVAADTTGTLVLQTGATPTTAMTIDASQNVGVGVTPSAWTASYKGLDIGSVGGIASNSASFTSYNNFYSGTNSTYKTTGFATAYRQGQDNGQHAWFVAPSGTAGTTVTFTQAMTLDASGKFLAGTTSGGADRGTFASAQASMNGLGLISTDDSSGGQFLVFRNSALTAIAAVARVGTTNAVVYNTTSDYRLKTVIGAVFGAGERIDALRPIDYQWTDGGQNSRGFLAHEFKEVYPNSVTGEKDAVDADGNAVYQAMQASTPEVIADLVAEIQSLRKRLAALENK